MTLKTLQQALARIFADEALLADFLDDPVATASRLDIDVRDAARLAKLDLHAVRHFAESLKQKRLLDARKMLPLTYRVLGSEFDRLTRAVTRGPPRAGRHRTDAAAFVRELCKAVEHDAVQPVWIGDLARYELAFIEASTAGTRCTLRWFRFPVAVIAAALMAGSAPISVEPRTLMGLWLRAGRVHKRLIVDLGIAFNRLTRRKHSHCPQETE